MAIAIVSVGVPPGGGGSPLSPADISPKENGMVVGRRIKIPPFSPPKRRSVLEHPVIKDLLEPCHDDKRGVDTVAKFFQNSLQARECVLLPGRLAKCIPCCAR